jgi:restriction system protein
VNFLDAAHQILQNARGPLHYTTIAQRALLQKLITPKGQTPAATMGSRLYVDTKKPNSRFKRISKGFFALVERSHTDDITQRVNAINQHTRKQLQKLLHDMPADRFEALVGELLIAIGFAEDTVEVTKYHADGGIDVRGILHAGGITKINAAVQVKKWKNNVSASIVRQVRGSLTTHEQGVIITTSNFSPGARNEADTLGKTPINLVNGDQLLDLLVEHGIAVNKEEHTVLSLDEEWWGELVGNTTESVTDNPPVPISTIVNITFPVIVQAGNDPSITAQLLNRQGWMVYNGQEYTSPSSAGKDASGWKSCNGWSFWRYQDSDTGQWQAIQHLRQVFSPTESV